jgi:hypothetical protein
MSTRTFNVYLYLNVRPNRKLWSITQWLEPHMGPIHVLSGEQSAWHWSCPRGIGCWGSRYRLEWCSYSKQWPVCKGRVNTAVSALLPFQSHLIMLVLVSTDTCARFQIARAGISEQLLVKLEKKMGPFFLKWLFKYGLLLPRALWVSLLLCSYLQRMRNTAFPLAALPSLLGLFCLVKMCPMY